MMHPASLILLLSIHIIDEILLGHGPCYLVRWHFATQFQNEIYTINQLTLIESISQLNHFTTNLASHPFHGEVPCLSSSCQVAASVSGKPSFKMDTAYSCTNLRASGSYQCIQVSNQGFPFGNAESRDKRLEKLADGSKFQVWRWSVYFRMRDGCHSHSMIQAPYLRTSRCHWERHIPPVSDNAINTCQPAGGFRSTTRTQPRHLIMSPAWPCRTRTRSTRGTKGIVQNSRTGQHLGVGVWDSHRQLLCWHMKIWTIIILMILWHPMAVVTIYTIHKAANWDTSDSWSNP